MRKTLVITGASRGIGAACVQRFAKEGFNIVLNYKHNEKAAMALIESLPQSTGQVFLPVQADVSQSDDVLALFQQVDETFGGLDVLVNNVGVLKTQTRVENISASRLNSIFETNVNSAFLCCAEAIKRMSMIYGGKGGSIINVSSAAARLGAPNEYVDYAASKGAMDSLTKGLALEVSREGIRVNSVRPGFIETDIHADGGEPNRVDRVKDQIPLGRGGSPVEVANAIYWLASEEASYVTGSFIDIAGGK